MKSQVKIRQKKTKTNIKEKYQDKYKLKGQEMFKSSEFMF